MWLARQVWMELAFGIPEKHAQQFKDVNSCANWIDISSQNGISTLQIVSISISISISASASSSTAGYLSKFNNLIRRACWLIRSTFHRSFNLTSVLPDWPFQPICEDASRTGNWFRLSDLSAIHFLLDRGLRKSVRGDIFLLSNSLRHREYAIVLRFICRLLPRLLIVIVSPPAQKMYA
jgi:hypothetical protein